MKTEQLRQWLEPTTCSLVEFNYVTVYKEGRRRKEIQRRPQAGAAAGTRVESIMWDRTLTTLLKGRELGDCIVPALSVGHVTRSRNNAVRRMCRVNRDGKKKMKELRDEGGMDKNS